ncbi:MAG: tRNA (N6-threonylcarbamoyladenosine(37)-N6)-methyltransferase TrmO [Eubacterium sp.]|nr:tRNA (N6-threonylcarbamoyladenosine(37)-N6)-methyltransferase TrmO [Eubacterium sp.]
MTEYSFTQIAHIENDYTEKFGIPRQSGLVDEVVSRIVFEPEYRNADALIGLQGFSHLWLIWFFSDIKKKRTTQTYPSFSPAVRPPRLGGNERVGVFASRSPNRPNPIGLSCVEIKEIIPSSPDGPVILVKGADLMSKTPILDIKPYITYTDARENAISGYADKPPETLKVEGLENLDPKIDKKAVGAILRQDIRPAYHDDPDRVYGFCYGNYNVRFKVVNNTVIIVDGSENDQSE